MGYGYVSFENLRVVVMLKHCGVRLSLPDRIPQGWRVKSGARRAKANMKPYRKAIKNAALLSTETDRAAYIKAISLRLGTFLLTSADFP